MVERLKIKYSDMEAFAFGAGSGAFKENAEELRSLMDDGRASSATTDQILASNTKKAWLELYGADISIWPQRLIDALETISVGVGLASFDNNVISALQNLRLTEEMVPAFDAAQAVVAQFIGQNGPMSRATTDLAEQALQLQQSNIVPESAARAGLHFVSDPLNLVIPMYAGGFIGRVTSAGVMRLGSALSLPSDAAVAVSTIAGLTTEAAGFVGSNNAIQYVAEGFSPPQGPWNAKAFRYDGSFLSETAASIAFFGGLRIFGWFGGVVRSILPAGPTGLALAKLTGHVTSVVGLASMENIQEAAAIAPASSQSFYERLVRAFFLHATVQSISGFIRPESSEPSPLIVKRSAKTFDLGRIHDAFLSRLAVTRFGKGLVIWCERKGVLINPGVSVFKALEDAGMNPSDLGYVALSEATPEIAMGLIGFIMRRERIKLFASPEVAARVIKFLSLPLMGDLDATRWIDFVPLEKGRAVEVPIAEGKKASVKLDGDGRIIFTYDGKEISETEGSKVVVAENLLQDPVQLKEYLSQVSILSHLDERDLATVAERGEVVEFKVGATVINKGAAPDYSYIILSGVVDVVDGANVLWSFYSRDFFGEVGMQSNSPRTATVKARTPLRLLRIDKDLYNNLIFNQLRASDKFLQVKYALEAFFKSVGDGVHLSEESVEAIAARSVKEDYVDDVREGEVGDSSYILVSGEVDVFKSGSSGPVATLKKGAMFGEMALLSPSSKRTATVKAKAGEKVAVLRIGRDLFEFILFTYPGVDRHIRQTMIERRRQNRDTLFEPHTVKLPSYFSEGLSGKGRFALNLWRGFCKKYGIDFNAFGFTLQEIESLSGKIDILRNVLSDLLGEAVLKQGMIKQVVFKGTSDAKGDTFDPARNKLEISRATLEAPAMDFARRVINSIGNIAAHYLLRHELLPTERDELERLPPIVDRSLNDLPGFLARFFELYIFSGEDLRSRIHSLRGKDSVRRGLETVYDIFKNLFFRGIEFTTLPSARSLVDVRQGAERFSTFDAHRAGKNIEEALNSIFGRYAAYGQTSLYQRLYEPELFNRYKLELLRRLKDELPQFHLQRFTDELVEISTFDHLSGVKYVIRFSREKDGALFKWRMRENGNGIEATQNATPVNVTLVNLESRRFGGVKGTPENVLTIEGYLRQNRAENSSVAVYDYQWGENNSDALINELEVNPPDIIGVSATFGTLSELESLLTRMSYLPKKPLVVVGGLLSTWAHEYILENYPDVISVRYEGEEALAKMVDLVARLPVDNRRNLIAQNIKELGHIPNIAFFHEGKVHKTSHTFVDLNDVPPPDRATFIKRQLPANWLLNAEGRARGCPYSGCFFCTRTHGKTRLFPLEHGIEDFRQYLEAQVPFIVYVDEDFLPDADPLAVKEFADAVIKMKRDFRSEFVAKHGREPVMPQFYIATRAQSIFTRGDDTGNVARLEALRLLKEAGLVKVFLGAESGSEVQFNKTYHKGGSIEEVEKAIEIIKREGMQVVAGFITFDPVITIKQLEEDLDFMERNGLVYVDSQTEPLNPFKFLRVQAGSVIKNRLEQIGLVSSSMDMDLLEYDTAYRNPLMRLMASAGGFWKDANSRLEYYLKGIIWFAEQSSAEQERAKAFIELFNRLKQEDFELISQMREVIRSSPWVGAERVNAFTDTLKSIPREKMLYELRRVLFPHLDMFASIEAYIKAHEGVAGFNAESFVSGSLNGEFPADFKFGASNADEYKGWLLDVRADIAQQMLTKAEVSSMVGRFDAILKTAVEKRRAILDDFAKKPWQDYYNIHPEAVRRGKEFQEALGEAILGHEELLKKGSPLLDSKSAELPRFKIFWRTSLDEYLNYRNPDLGEVVANLFGVLQYLRENPEVRVSKLEDIYIYQDGRLSFNEEASVKDHMAIVRQAMTKLFLQTANYAAFGSIARTRLLEMYKRAKASEIRNLSDAIVNLQILYKLVASEVKVSTGDVNLAAIPLSLDGNIEFWTGSKRQTVLRNEKLKYVAARITATEEPSQEMWRQAIANRASLPEQQRLNVINSLVEIMSASTLPKAGWLSRLAQDLDQELEPRYVYLPDEPEYHAYKEKYPDINFAFVHPGLYSELWPGIEPHLEKLLYLAHPEVLNDYENMLALVDNGDITPAWAQFIYEIYYNRVSPKAFLRNDNPEHIIKNYSPLALRIMPKRTPVLVLDASDGRLTIFKAATDDVRSKMTGPDGKVRFVVHPQVYAEWIKQGVDLSDMGMEWTLTFPTSSSRTLYVLDDRGDYIAKTHSLIWIGPAVRHLTLDNVYHSSNVSQQIALALDEGSLPRSIRGEFAFINDSAGVVINDPKLYPEKGSVGVIIRSTAAYPAEGADRRVLIPAFALHNNANTIEGNPADDILVRLVEHNTRGTGESPVAYFMDNIVRPLYRHFFYYMFKQGILIEPHGQNFYIEVDPSSGKITRLVFKDWQSTMVDMETRIKRDLPEGDIRKHLLDREAGVSLSLSLVFDYYFGSYLFEKIVNTVSEAYHGNRSPAIFKLALIAHLKKIFAEELSLYHQRQEDFPDRVVRHDKKPKDDRTNDVYFRIEGPPEFRTTSFERAVELAIAERRFRGKIDLASISVEGKNARLKGEGFDWVPGLDLEGLRLSVKRGGAWEDVRESPPKGVGADNAYYMVLPKDFDPAKRYPLIVILHGMNSNLSEAMSWTGKLNRDDAVVVVPFAPFKVGEGEYSWFRGTSLEDKNVSLRLLDEVIQDVRGQLNIDKVVLGGMSQGGYMALHAAAVNPAPFDAIFTVNAPFAPEYLGDEKRDIHGEGKKIGIFHLSDDPIVGANNSSRAEGFFEERGFDVSRDLFMSGEHQVLSSSTAGEIGQFLDSVLRGHTRIDLPSPGDMALEIGREPGAAHILGAVEMIGKNGVQGYEGVLYEAMLDVKKPLALRSTSLISLMQLKFGPVFTAWEETTLLNEFAEAGGKLGFIERAVPFLTSHIAFIGIEKLSEKERMAFDMIVANFEQAVYRYWRYSRQPIADSGEVSVKELAQMIDYMSGMAQKLMARVSKMASDQ